MLLMFHAQIMVPRTALKNMSVWTMLKPDCQSVSGCWRAFKIGERYKARFQVGWEVFGVVIPGQVVAVLEETWCGRYAGAALAVVMWRRPI